MSDEGDEVTRINPQFSKVTKIQYSLNNEDLMGTGFYFELDGEFYLVTNRHVFRHEYGVSPESIRIHYRSPDNLGNIHGHTETLFENSTKSDQRQAKWFEHDNNNGIKKADVAVLPLDLDLEQTASIAYCSGDYLPDRIDLRGGNAAAVIGYPYDITDHHSYFPVIRHATIATPFGHPYNGNWCFVIDSTQQPGSSGSPVITSSSHMYFDKNGQQIPGGESLLGIFSGGIIDEKDLGLYRVWYVDWIEFLIQEGYRPKFD